MQILKAIGLLMEYPDDELWECRDEALALIQHDAPMLANFTRELLYAPLLDKQAEWCEVFDRGRATSLLLFEQLHCCYSSMFMRSPAIAARRWSIC